jgi:hypothetical protein
MTGGRGYRSRTYSLIKKYSKEIYITTSHSLMDEAININGNKWQWTSFELH